MLRSSVLGVLVLTSPALAQDMHRFQFAPVGQSYTAAIFEGNPLAGREVVSTRIELHVRVDPGSDGAEFVTDIALPIQTVGGGNFLVLTGADLGWSGSGEFHFAQTTDGFNGTIVTGRYGAETYGVQGGLLDGSFIEVTLAPAACPADLDDGTGTGTPDGGVTVDDLVYFVSAFALGDPAADLDDDGIDPPQPDGGVTIEDLVFFLTRFSEGC